MDIDRKSVYVGFDFDLYGIYVYVEYYMSICMMYVFVIIIWYFIVYKE